MVAQAAAENTKLAAVHEAKRVGGWVLFVLSRGFQIPEVTMLIKCFSLQYKNNAHVGLINVWNMKR